MSGDVERMQAAFIGVFQTMTEGVAGRSVFRNEGVFSATTRSPIPLFNPILIEHSDATPDGFRIAVRNSADQGVRVSALLRSGVDRRFVDVATDLGLEQSSESAPGMALKTIADSTSPAGLEIRTSGAVLYDHHVSLVAAGFGMPPSLVDTFMSPVMQARADVQFHVGYIDAEPVATSFGFVHSGSVTVFNVATSPAFQRRGFGAAMTMQAIAGGVRSGCDVAYLQSTPAGIRVYERLGFRVVVTYEQWITPVQRSR